MIKITIITINYNNGSNLLKTFNSISEQNFTEFEYIVIDGGSTDSSLELTKNNSHINYFVSEKDNGVYHAMNKGIKASKGEFLIFMNSGDTFYSNTVLENINSKLNDHYDIVYGNANYYNDDGYKRTEIPPDVLTFGYLKIFGLNHQSVFIRKKLFFDTSFYNEDYKICADWEFFMINICLKNVSYLHVDLMICNYDFSGISAKPENLNLYSQEKNNTLNKYFPLFMDDLSNLENFRLKRIKQVLYIKDNKKISWRFLKWFLDMTLIFTNKKKIK
ncbi:MAG: glycosyltransferase [Flavobacterium sp.]|nr:glycosyltransferase [Flavobacterium sp.]